jgi:very-short-patch-repair endonuclease
MGQQEGPPAEQDPTRSRAISLYTFLKELTELRTKAVRSISEYEKVLWFANLPREPGVRCSAWDASDEEDAADTWIEIRKPHLKAPPQPTADLSPWLDLEQLANSSRDIPELKTEIVVEIPISEGEDSVGVRTEVKRLEEYPEVRTKWERYVEEKWWPWADEDRRLQRVQEVYTELFYIYQRQLRLGEQYEVVIGLGLLTWRTPDGQEIRRHIITAQTSLRFDSVRGIISVGPAGEGARPALEQEMLDPQFRPDPTQLQALEMQASEIGEEIWDHTSVGTVLSSWVHSVSSKGAYEESLEPQEKVLPEPRVTFAPAVVLRARTERFFLRIFAEILRKLRSGEAIPPGVDRFLGANAGDGRDQQTSIDKENVSGQQSEVREIYFPLESNEEQRTIIQRLAKHDGVLVQGPPGTGKSHTIVNLISHLIATGQKVLVTSHTARALRVLRGYILDKAAEIAPLAVVLLGDDREALQAMEDSVQGITDRHNSWNSMQTAKEIAKLEGELDSTRREEGRVLQDICAVREAETYSHPGHLGDYRGTAQAIAIRLRRESDQYEWFTDGPSEDNEVPLSEAECVELLGLLRNEQLNTAIESMAADIDPASVPNPEVLAELFHQEGDALASLKTCEEARKHSAYEPLRRSPLATRKSLSEGILSLLLGFDRVASHIQPWTEGAATEILADQDRHWKELLAATRFHLDKIADRTRWADTTAVSGLGMRNHRVVKIEAQILLEHLDKGGRKGFGPFRPAPVKQALYLLREVHVAGKLCDSPHVLRELISWLEVWEQLEDLRSLWDKLAKVTSTSFARQVAEYQDFCEPLEAALDLHPKVSELKETVRQIKGLPQPVWHDIGGLKQLLALMEAISVAENSEAITQSLREKEKQIRKAFDTDTTDSLKDGMLEALRKRDVEAYLWTHGELTRNFRIGQGLQRRDWLLTLLESTAPQLAEDLSVHADDPVWDERLKRLRGAWDWARASVWIQRLSDPEAEEELRIQLDNCRHRVRSLLQKLAALKAWQHCFERMSDEERQHLVAWSKAMRRIGKGKGKYAPQHRREAQLHMEGCRTAIPAWVMPIYRVAESIRPEKDLFDVVIVDEASQSGPEALFLLYLTKKMVVVGDDKQISPDSVGLNREDVNQLRDRHISKLPHNDAYGLENSFFDLAEIRYGGRIRLREHFRCMPEIIQFSNNLCYRSEPLIPLKQFGAGRLSPVVCTRHVKEGYIRGGERIVINPPEAEAIVAEISRCCQDQAYEKKSFGVISLRGDHQARYVEKLLLEKVGPEEMERRQLVCGDAYAFQGDERDVIFLSLVVAPGESAHIRALADPLGRDMRRFNVAASRAKEQMWLFHTGTLNDLSPADLRHQLLNYCLEPKVQQGVVKGIDVDQLTHLAAVADRNRTSPPDPFDSWFEVDVFLKIVGRGYRVTPQFEIAGRRIDFVVEGMDRRLAVECDGDKWHGPERYLEDMGRQRMLERCGCKFWRLRGSTFYLDPEKALDGLWETLERLKVYPDGHEPVKRQDRPSDHPEQPEPAKRPITQQRMTRVGFLDGFSPVETVPGSLFAKDIPALSGDEALEGTSTGIRPTNSEQKHSLGLEDASYRHWPMKALPDPRSCSVQDMVTGLVEIVSVEGPMVAYRAYQLFARSAGLQRVGKQIALALRKALRKAIRDGLLEEQSETESRNPEELIVRESGSPAVIVRLRGGRDFGEIPPSEIGQVMTRLRVRSPGIVGPELHRAVLEFYEIKRMTGNIEARLRWIEQRQGEVAGENS